MRNHRGFTLLEVMVSLAIFSLVALASGRATQMQLVSWSILEQEALAGIVATNAMEEARALHVVSSPGSVESLRTIAGIPMRAVITVRQTDTPNFYIISIDVYSKVTPASGEYSLYHIESGKYARPV